ncbi:MAG: hypothetical protein KC931_11790, partial [Candidatus Omnitrophica bacterium]|nr:hypothetical protein [Candidatus Omnitrophota bacterium]
MNSLVPLFQILKGAISNCPRFSFLPAIVFIGSVGLFPSPTFSETIQITPKNGVPSSWDLVSVEPDRIIVRKGGARFEFSRDQIENVSNPEVSKLVARARVLLSEVEKLDPLTFPKIETEMEKILPSLEGAAQQFNWLMPELVEVRDRVAEMKDAIGKTLDLTSGFGPDLEAIEKMAGGKSPVATNWEEVVENTLKGAQEIPIEEIRTQVVEDLNTFRRSIRLSLVRRTEETEKRVRSSGEALLADLAKGEIDRAQWTLRLRDLRRQVAEQVPDADLRLELEEYLNQMEANSEDELVAAEEMIAQRQIRKSLEALDSLVLDTTRSEEFVTGSEALSAEIAQLPDSATKSELQEALEIYRFDHQEALAQLQRSQEPNLDPKPVETGNAATKEPGPSSSLLSDWRVIAGAVLGLVALLAAMKMLPSKLGKGKRSASEIEDVKVVSLQPTDEG